MNMQMYQRIIDTDGKIFTVKFFKRSNSELRVMNCRLGVKKDLKGDGPKYDAFSKGLITVYDMQAKGYRNINMECVISITIGGKEIMNENLVEDIRKQLFNVNNR